MANPSLVEQSGPFLAFLDEWMSNLPVKTMRQTLPKPEHCALLSVDLTAGFCDAGPLSGPRVRALAAPAAAFMQAAWQHGVTAQVLLQDTHSPDAPEFASWPPHCVRGTAEAETVGEIKTLPFFDRLEVIEKDSISSNLNTALPAWLADRPAMDTFVVIGDCTDLCVYQLAMFLRLDADARGLRRRVIVPAALVDTYDFPVDAAQAAGAMPHPGDLFHAAALYHLALNGVEVVKRIDINL